MNDFIEFLIGFVIMVVVVVGLIFSVAYYASCRNADVINGRYNTNFTCSEMLWSGETLTNEVIGYKIIKQDK